MAEYKLGRIKFVYQGTWASSTAYVVDDVVSVGGKTYICTTSNTSSALFSSDLASNYWSLVADGTRWTGTWANATYYQLGDQALYGGIVYQCTTAHTSTTATATLTATGFTVSSGTATLTYASQVVQPFLVGATVTLAGFTPTQTSGTVNTVNTTFTVVTCSQTQVTFALTGTYTVSTLGTVAGASQLGLEQNQASWTAFATSVNYAGAWTVNTRYKTNDLVTYGGYTYIAITAHVSASTTAVGLEQDIAKWSTFNPGLSYQGAWSGSSVKYRLNDIVKYGASLFICTTAHVSSATFSTSNFTTFVNGLQYVPGGSNQWSSATAYVTGDIVAYGGNLYVATTTASNNNQNPVTATSYWSLFTGGFSYQGAWSGVGTYKVGQVVTLGGYTYLAVADNTQSVLTAQATTVTTNIITLSASTTVLVANLPVVFGTTFGGLTAGQTYYVIGSSITANTFQVSTISGSSTPVTLSTTTGQSVTVTTQSQPPFATYWSKLNSGVSYKPTTGTYTAVAATNVTGTGTSATFNVTASKTAYTVTLNAGGSGYSATGGSNTVKILGSSLGGLSPANDITVTITGVSTGAITTFTSVGYAVTWANAVTYVLGDVVYFGSNSYICVSGHVSATGTNRPDADTTATYWNLLAAGNESAVLTVTGDLFYYGSTGPTRLPIGSDGQVLRVNTNIPSWAYYGQINNIVYVSSATGADVLTNSQGTTLDKPWKTIQFAAQQIENGYINTNIGNLLQINKQFLLKEVNNFVLYNYTFNITNTTVTTNVITVGGSSTIAQTATTNLYSNMPISFTTTAGGITAGTTYYVIGASITATTFQIATIPSTSGTQTAVTLSTTSTANLGQYVYSQSKTERDTGLVLDGIIFDITHGGNSKTIANGLSYFTASGTSYTSGVAAYDISPFVKALNYLSTLATNNIVANTAPGTNYQTTISPAVTVTGASGTGAVATITFAAQSYAYTVGSQITVASINPSGYNGTFVVLSSTTTSVSYANTTTGSYVSGGTVNYTRAVQQINTTYTAESAIIPRIAVLVGYVTTPLSVGNTTSITGILANPSTTISVKTGTYNEVLPIVVPAYTAVFGDELRSSTIQPAIATLTLVNDKPKTVAVLTRLQTQMANLLQNTSISGSTNNTQYLTVSASSGAASVATLTFAAQTTAPFSVGQFITVSGFTSTAAGYNGSYAVTACTTTSVSYANATTAASSGSPIVSGQNTQLAVADVGSTTAVNTINTFTSSINNMIFNGLAQVPAISITTVTGYNTSFLPGHSTGVTQITSNYAFIKAELTAFMNTNYNSVWSGLGVAGQQLYLLQIQYILDGMQYDMAYGCNNQSIINGSSYYSLNIAQVPTASQPAYLATFQRLQAIVGQIVRAQSVSATSGNGVTQTTGSDAGIAPAAFASARIADVIYWFQNGSANSTVNTITGSISGTTLTVTTQTSAVAPGTLLTGTGINGMYIVNQITSTAGASAATTYNSGGSVGTSTFVVSSATGIAAGQFITGTGIPNGTYVASTYVSASTTVPIANYFGSPVTFTVQASGAYLFYPANTAGTYTLSITGGTGTAFTSLSTFTPITSGAYTLVGSNALQFAYTQLQAKATEIASDAQAFVYKYNHAYNISSTLTNRDAGLIVNGLSFDVLFTTNFNTITIGRAFNRTNTSAQALLNNVLNELNATTATINFIGFKAKMIAAAGGQVQAQTLLDDIIYRINGQATTTLTTATTSTNVLTVSSTSAMSVNQPITFTGLPANITTTVPSTLAAFAGSITVTTATALTGVGTITSNGAGSFTFGTPQSAGTFYTGQVLTITGSLSGVTWTGYTTGTSYVVTATNGTSTISLTTVTGSAISVTTGTATGITFNTYLATITTTGLIVGSAIALSSTSFGGLSTGTTYYVIGFGPTASASCALSLTPGGNSVAMTSSSGVLIAQTTSNLLNLGGYTSTLGITTGQQCYFSGAVYAGITPYQLYYIVSASGTGITVSTTSGGGAITLGSASGSMTLTVNAAGGIWANNQYYINTIASGTTLTITNSYKSGTAYTVTNTVSGMTATSTFGPTATVLYYNSPMIHGSTVYNGTVTTVNAAEIIRANIGFLSAEATAYVGASYGGSVSSTAATTNLITTTGNHNFTVGDPVQFSGSVVGGLSAGTTYWVLTVNSNTSFTVSLTQASQGTQTAVVLTNTSSAFNVNYFSTAQSYVTSFLNGMIYDLQYTGNNRSLRAVEIYNNAVSGSTISNMFLVRNGCGIRNVTMTGITGTLSTVNANGTKRPTGGAYTSLDPGFGPNDTNVQILSRSTYVQNCTIFGYAAYGAKVDGALHAGGNRSIVANDYTCIIGDGIGWMTTGSGSLSELVSVFNYYSYVGYMADLGGRIRATNGNSSYGTYGVIAEGTDTFETPIYATLNNRGAPAQISTVVTDSTTQILRFEYSNAGINYTNTVPSISGSGYNAVAFQDEFRDASVFETRLIDPNNTGLTGGTSYVSAVNVGQINARGPGNQLIANADGALSGTYNGMNLLLTAGTGVGQYATILSYDNTSKYAQIVRPTFKTLSVTTSTNATAASSSSATIATYAGQYPTLVAPVMGSGSYVAGMFLTSSGTITAGTYITAINTGTITTASIASSTFSSTGSIGASITGAGTTANPWVATITGMSSTSGFVVGAQITATNGTGTLYGSTPTSVIVTSIPSTTSITYSVIGGTIPTTGTITNVQQTMLSASAFSNLLPGMVLSGGSVIASYVAGQVTATGTALATATMTGTIGTSTLTLTSFTVGSAYTVLVGQYVAQISGIPAGTYITAVNPATGVITINTTLYGAVSGSNSTYTAGGNGTYALTANSFTTITGTPTAGTQYLLNIAQTQIAATVTGTQNTLSVASNASLYNTMPIFLGNAVANLAGVAIASTGAITFTTTTTALPSNTQVVVSGTNVGTGIVATGTFFVASSPSPTATGVTLLTALSGGTTISTTAGTVITSGNLASVNIGASGNLTFTALGAALPAGTPIVISGSNGGSGSIANGTYYVASSPTPTASAVTLVTTSGGSTSPITTSGTPSGLTFAFSLVNPLTFTYTLTAPFGLTSYTTYFVQGVTNAAGVASTTFSLTTTVNGTAPAIVNNIVSQNVSLYAAGWDHVVPGTAINNTTDLTTAYIIEPAVSYSSPGYIAPARTLQTSASYTGVAYGAGNYVAISTGATTTQYSTTGRAWNNGGALPSAAAWNAVTYGGGQGAQATVTVGGFGGTGAVLTAVIVGGQITGITIVNGGFNYTTVPTITITPISGGSGASAIATVLNGTITTVTMLINGSGYASGATVAVVTSAVSSVVPVTWGKNYGYNSTTPSVTLNAPFSGTVWSSGGTGTSGSYYYFLNTGVTPNVTNYYQATSTGSFTTSGPTHTTGTVANGTVNLLYVGTQAVVTPTLTNTGISGYTVTVAGFGYTTVPTITIADLSARFVAISPTTAGANVAPTGISGAWSSMTTPSAGYNAITYGLGQYVVVGGTAGAGIIASSGDGSSWSARTVPAAASAQYFSAVAYGSTGTGLSGNTTTGLFIAIPLYGNIPVTSTNGSTWAVPQTSLGGNVTLPATLAWSAIAYGNGRFVAIASNSSSIAYTINGGGSWNLATVGGGAGLPGVYGWSSIAYGEGQFVAIAANSAVSATSWDGINWTIQTLPATQNWSSVVFGNPLAANIGYNPLFVAVANTAGTTAAVIHTGATPVGRLKVTSNAISEVRMIEPGSGFAKGNVTATTAGTNLITADNIENLVANQPVEFNTVSSGGLSLQTTYYVIGSSITTTSAPAGTFQVSTTSGGTTAVTLTTTAPTGMTYTTGPIVTITDPNRINAALVRVRTGDGVLGNPSFPNRGAANATATANQAGDGYSDIYQISTFINVSGLYQQPTAGANVQFASISNTWYKLVSVTNLLGIAGNYTATFQINPGLSVYLAPTTGNLITTRLKYSQVRLTGHDFLYIGTGNQTLTNYPNVVTANAISANQTLNNVGGRTFFTSTDQDGNFNVGNLFGVQQATGTASLNASAFNLAGLQSLQLGSVTVGIGSATITSFSTDPYFTANSDNIVPTQKAIKSYITAQIGGGSSSLNVNTLTAGVIFVGNNQIYNTTGYQQIYVSSKMLFTGGIDGAPVALTFFAQR